MNPANETVYNRTRGPLEVPDHDRSWDSQQVMLVNVTVRPLEAKDASAIRDAALEAWKYTYRDIFDLPFIENFVNRNYAPQATLALMPGIEAGSIFFHVAEYQSQVIGFCNIGVTDSVAEPYRIYVLPVYIGQGIGGRLLEQGEHFLAEKGIDRYFCYVHNRNEIGKRFYLRNGFQHVTEKDKDDEWYMEKRLPLN